jgi:hypothetical protein
MVIASWLSVTVSIAADINGIFSDIRRVSRVCVLASDGKTEDAAGFQQHIIKSKRFGNGFDFIRHDASGYVGGSYLYLMLAHLKR